MPMVGKKEFPYTKKGKAAAKAYAKRTGKSMKNHERTEGKKERMMEYGKKGARKK
jgi:hypothetical protein